MTHTYSNGVGEWDVPRLWALASDLPVVEQAPERFLEWHMPEFGPTWMMLSSMAEYAVHVRRILDADLSYPVIVSAEGHIMDGNHRLIKAWLEGVPVKKVCFLKTPAPDRLVGDSA